MYLVKRLNFPAADLVLQDNYFFAEQVPFVAVGILEKALEFEDYVNPRMLVLLENIDLASNSKKIIIIIHSIAFQNVKIPFYIHLFIYFND
jgi:hypothetical protein